MLSDDSNVVLINPIVNLASNRMFQSASVRTALAACLAQCEEGAPRHGRCAPRCVEPRPCSQFDHLRCKELVVLNINIEERQEERSRGDRRGEWRRKGRGRGRVDRCSYVISRDVLLYYRSMRLDRVFLRFSVCHSLYSM